jgi:hypothetical protein
MAAHRTDCSALLSPTLDTSPLDYAAGMPITSTSMS